MTMAHAPSCRRHRNPLVSLRKVAARQGVHHLPNLGGCPAR